MASEQEIIEEELVYGALRRERLWQRLGLIGLIFGILGLSECCGCRNPRCRSAPVVVPYDPATGFALPEASVGATTVTENQAIIEAEVFRYISDREVYNQLDNDVRVRSVLRRSDGAAEASLRQIWNSANADYPPTLYGTSGRLGCRSPEYQSDRHQPRHGSPAQAPELYQWRPNRPLHRHASL